MIVAKNGHAFGVGDPPVVHARPGRLDRPSRLALSAAQQVFKEPAGERPRLGVWIVSQYGAFAANADHWQMFLSKGTAGVSPLVFPATVPSAAAAEIAIAVGAMGPNVTLCGGPRAAVDLFGLACDAIASGVCDEALVGAVDGWHPRLAALGFSEATIDGCVVARIGRGAQVPALAALPATTVRAFEALCAASV